MRSNWIGTDVIDILSRHIVLLIGKRGPDARQNRGDQSDGGGGSRGWNRALRFGKKYFPLDYHPAQAHKRVLHDVFVKRLSTATGRNEKPNVGSMVAYDDGIGVDTTPAVDDEHVITGDEARKRPMQAASKFIGRRTGSDGFAYRER